MNTDLISREAVLSIIEESQEDDADEWMDYPWKVTPNLLMDEVRKLPSVTPKQEPFMNKPCISEGVCHDSAVQMLDNAISRTLAMETFAHWAEHKDYTHVERHILHAVVDELRAMPSIGEQPDEWTPIFKDLYDGMAEGGNHDRME